MSTRRKTCVVTGSRAEYGLLLPLLRRIEASKLLSLQIVATGMHLSPEFGLTYRNIEADGFRIDDRVEMLLSSDTSVGVTKAVGLGVIGLADVFGRAPPDVVVLLGDRFETFAAAQAAFLARLPIAHLHGGESTEGAFDDSLRHAITKMAHLHFVAAAPYRDRVIQMGESPERVFQVGALGLDNIGALDVLPKAAVEERLEVRLGTPTFLVTYHPVTLATEGPGRALRALFDALDAFPNASVVMTGSNADPSGRVIERAMRDYAEQRPGRAAFRTTLGHHLYLNTMRFADVVVGNSSSGLIETPALGKPTVNLGERQGGRLRGPSVIDCVEEASAIRSALERALSDEFRSRLDPRENPYGVGGGIAQKIVSVLEQADLGALRMKRFHDLPPNEVGR